MGTGRRCLDWGEPAGWGEAGAVLMQASCLGRAGPMRRKVMVLDRQFSIHNAEGGGHCATGPSEDTGVWAGTGVQDCGRSCQWGHSKK